MEELTALYRTKTDNDQGLGKFHSFHPPAVAPEGSILPLLLTL